MALITCPECCHSVSDKATACPNCGFPLSERQITPPSGRSSGIKDGVRCPYCKSTSYQMVKKGFSFDKAATGSILFGPAGAVAGLASDKYQRVCVACGRKF